MIYVIDTSSIRCWSAYYPGAFDKFWQDLEDLVTEGRLVSVREVYRELEVQNTSEHVASWAKDHKTLFSMPTEEEMRIVAEILTIPHFQLLIGEKQRLRSGPVADPWLIARAKVLEACVVTEEALKPNAAKIPNVCAHFGIPHTTWGGVVLAEKWKY